MNFNILQWSYSSLFQFKGEIDVLSVGLTEPIEEPWGTNLFYETETWSSFQAATSHPSQEKLFYYWMALEPDFWQYVHSIFERIYIFWSLLTWKNSFCSNNMFLILILGESFGIQCLAIFRWGFKREIRGFWNGKL